MGIFASSPALEKCRYRKLLTLWGQAYPAFVPVVGDARKRLAALEAE